ncbi:tetratricopeptide repeat protein [Primorskyibacter sp. S87]|uniref:tetratricopeptide repeat protein n=1 Tax=Primorskyibacter sp. S87 TaxID=3415126 RepID=UPI003C7DCA7E
MFVTAALAQEADLNDEAELLRRLAVAEPAEAINLDRQLQALWDKSGSPAMDLLLERGKDAMEVGEFRIAIEHFTALTDHAPDFAEGWFMRASAYFQADLLGPAMADLERALMLNPNNYNALLGLGAVLEMVDRPKLAYRAYVRAQAIHPHHEDISTAAERLRLHVEGDAL